MSHAQYLRDLLRPLGVYNLEAPFNGGEKFHKSLQPGPGQLQVLDGLPAGEVVLQLLPGEEPEVILDAQIAPAADLPVSSDTLPLLGALTVEEKP